MTQHIDFKFIHDTTHWQEKRW